MMRKVLGIDGGGTKTEAVIADETGRVLGRGRSGPGNIDDIGEEAARANIVDAVEQARRVSGLGEYPFDGAFLGLAGVISDSDRAIVRRIASSLELADVSRTGIDHDCRIALAGGLAGRPGIVLIAGTGSSCYGRTSGGASWRSAGWGHLVSDEGSSYWLGIQAMTAAVRAFDGRGESTVLVERVLHSMGLGEMNDLMHRLYVEGMSRSEVAALAPIVVGAARDGDAVSLRLLDEGGDWLARSIAAVSGKLGFDESGCEVALVGGLFRAGELVAGPLRSRLAVDLPLVQLRKPELAPVLGAALLAIEQAGGAINRKIAARLGSGVT